MEIAEKIKVVVIAVFTAITGLLGWMSIPVFLLVAANVLDYITGIAAAKYRGQAINSKRGYRGIVKKISMWILVIVGWMIDVLIGYGLEGTGLAISYPYVVVAVVAVWLLVNEWISIIENVGDIEALPPFLLPIVRNLKKKLEKTAEVKEDDNDQNPEE